MIRKLIAKNSNVHPFEYSDGFWTWLLKHVGLSLRTGDNITEGKGTKLYYRKDENELHEDENINADPYEGGKYFVTEQQAEIMAHLTKHLVVLEEKRHRIFRELSPQQQIDLGEEIVKKSSAVCIPAPHTKLNHAEKFIVFAQQSGGFYIL